MKTIINFTAILLLSCAGIYSQWQQTASTPQGAGVTDMVVLNDGTLIVTTASFNWPNGQPGGIRRSTDGGATWQNINNVYNARTLWLGSTGKIFASYWPYPSAESAYYSTNNGLNWNLLLTLSGTNNIFSIATKNNDSAIFLGTRDGIKRSTNNGNAFINLTNGLPANSWVRDLAIIKNGTIIAATTNGIFCSTNNGNLWVPVTGLQAGDTVTSVSVDSTNMSDGGWEYEVYGGSLRGNLYTFEQQGVNGPIIITRQQSIASNVEIIIPRNFSFENLTRIVGAYSASNSPNGGMYISFDIGYSWLHEPSQEEQRRMSAIHAKQFYEDNNSYILEFYAGMFENTDNGAKIYKRMYLIGIQQISSQVPEGFSLSQNYPNPFNPTTNIEFAIPKSSFVKLVVYDIMGREVETLVSKDLKAGTYKADWNAAKYTSGVYFYCLVVGGNTNNGDGFIETKKMILIK